jgi:hypothetical protein
MAEEDELVTLRSSDEEKFEVSQEVAFKSETIKNMIEGASPLTLAFFTCAPFFNAA